MGKKLVPPQDPSRVGVVHDDKRRTIGVDVSALESQLQEKQMRLEDEGRERRRMDSAWTASWQYVEEMYTKRDMERRERQLRYHVEIQQQMEEKRGEHERGLHAESQCGGTGGGFLDGFGRSHR